MAATATRREFDHLAMSIELGAVATWRSHLGTSTRLWGGEHPRHLVEPGLWFNFSGAPSVDYNVACCATSDSNAIERCLEEARAAHVPALVMLAGKGLGAARALADADWICVGSVPLMVRPIEPRGVHASVRRLEIDDLSDLRPIMERCFQLDPTLSALALPDQVASDDDAVSAWGLFSVGRLVAGVITVVVGDSACIWSMVTDPDARRNGFGRLLIESVHTRVFDLGARRSLLLASPEGEAFYRRVGYVTAEHWQVWSRARWMFA